jgi:hypothetical protein
MQLMDLPPGFRIPGDATSAEWLRGRDGTGSGRPLADAFPPGFTEFVRVLHPCYRLSREGSVTWRETFSSHGHALAAESSWFREMDDRSDDDLFWPEDNSLSQPEATVVASILTEHTGDPEDCWFQWSPVRGLPFEHGTDLVRVRGLLDSWRIRRAGMKRSREAMRLERSLPSMGGGVLIQGSLKSLIDAAPRWVPSVWWPTDHAWVVSTGVDSVSTYVAGSEACVGALLGDPRLEALRVSGVDIVTV